MAAPSRTNPVAVFAFIVAQLGWRAFKDSTSIAQPRRTSAPPPTARTPLAAANHLAHRSEPVPAVLSLVMWTSTFRIPLATAIRPVKQSKVGLHGRRCVDPYQAYPYGHCACRNCGTASQRRQRSLRKICRGPPRRLTPPCSRSGKAQIDNGTTSWTTEVELPTAGASGQDDLGPFRTVGWTPDPRQPALLAADRTEQGAQRRGRNRRAWRRQRRPGSRGRPVRDLSRHRRAGPVDGPV